MTDEVKTVLEWKDGVQVVRPMTPEEIEVAFKPIDPVQERAAMVVDPVRLKIALHQAGYLDQAERAITDRGSYMIKLTWNGVWDFARLGPMVTFLQAELGLDDAATDELLRLAIEIKL